MVEELFTLLAHPGDDPKARQTPKFMGQAVNVLEMKEEISEKPRPLDLKEDLLLDSTLSSPFFTEAIKRAWFVYAKDNVGTLAEHIAKLKESVGISLSHGSDPLVQVMDGVKYKLVAKKVIPVSTQDPEGTIPVYRDIYVGDLEKLPEVPMKMEDLRFLKILTKE